jgi:hypothetical protein
MHDFSFMILSMNSFGGAHVFNRYQKPCKCAGRALLLNHRFSKRGCIVSLSNDMLGASND